MFLVGFEFKTKELLGSNLVCTCPSCRKNIKIPKGTVLKEFKAISPISKLTKSFSCSCGYSSNFITVNMKKVDLAVQFKRTCRECGATWNFNRDDVLLSKYGKMAFVTSPVQQHGVNKEADLNRCFSCGSRNVSLEVGDIPKSRLELAIEEVERNKEARKLKKEQKKLEKESGKQEKDMSERNKSFSDKIIDLTNKMNDWTEESKKKRKKSED